MFVYGTNFANITYHFDITISFANFFHAFNVDSGSSTGYAYVMVIWNGSFSGVVTDHGYVVTTFS